MKKIIYLLILMIAPTFVSALELKLTPNKTAVKPNDMITFTLTTSEAIGSTVFDITYDSTKWTYMNFNSKYQATSNNLTGKIKFSISDKNGITGTMVTLTLQAKAHVVTGSSTIGVSTNDIWSLDGSTPLFPVITPAVVTHYLPSTNANLKSLTVSGCNISFNPNTLNYKCPETNANEIAVNAVAEDSKTKVSGIGNIKLKYGSNSIIVKTVAENGAQKNYMISIVKTDERSTENRLAFLEVEGQKIDFNPDLNVYNLEVNNTVNEIVVNGTVKDSKSTVLGLGTKPLYLGENIIEIAVIAENQSKNIYKIIVNKLEKENIPSTELVSLIVNSKEIMLNNKDNIYNISTDIYPLNIVANTSSKTSKIEIIGNDNLKDGINVITIKVTDTSVLESIYTLIVNKISNNINILTTLNFDNLEKDSLINVLENEDYLVKKELLKKLNDKTLYYNVVNKNGGLIYSLNLNKDTNLDNDINFKLFELNNNPQTYISNIPNNVNVKLFVSDTSLNNKKINLYSYNKKSGKYVLVKKDAEVKDYYVEFTSNGDSEYVLTNDNLNTNLNIILYIIFFIAGVIVTILGFIIKNKFVSIKNNKVEQIEML